MSSQPCILAALADLHGGFRLGLMTPGLRLKDHDGVLNEFQNYLWELYTRCLDRTVALAGGRPIVAIFDGDIGHGNKYPVELVSTALSDQIKIAAGNIRPWCKIPNTRAVRIVAGTGAHEYGEGSITSLVVDQLQGEFPALDIKEVNHGLMTLGERSIDYAHHGAHPGSRAWLRGNVARFFLRDRMLQDILDGGKPSDLYLCAHFHQLVHEVLETGVYRSELYILPSFAGVGEHTRQATRSAPTLTNGMVVFEIGETVVSHPLVQTIDVREREILCPNN